MKKELSAFDLHYLADEFRVLEQGKIDGVYQPEKKTLILQAHVTGVGKKLLRIEVPNFIYFTSYKQKSPEKPFGFCMFLRKRIKGGRIRGVSQQGFERVVSIKIESKEGVFNLVIELFGKGNIILCDEHGIIISPLERQALRDRKIEKGVEYALPERRFDLFKPDLKAMEGILLGSEQDSLVKMLAKDLGAGGVMAEEICLAAGADKKIRKIDAALVKKIHAAVTEIVSRKAFPSAVLKGGSAADIVPIELDSYKEYGRKSFDTFNEALDSVLSAGVKAEDEEKKESKYSKQIKKLKNIIAMQEKQVNAMRRDIGENTKKAEAIYQNYNLIRDMISEINKAAKRYSWKEIKEKLKGHKIVKEINLKEKKITIEIPSTSS